MHRLRTLPLLLLAVVLALLGLTGTPPTALAQEPSEAAVAPAADEAPSDEAGDPPPPNGSEDDAPAAMADDAVDDTPDDADAAAPSPWSTGLLLSWAALIVGGGSAVIGIWVDRDKTRPVSFAYAMSVLISCAVVVGCAQGYLDAMDHIQKEQDLERMLDMTYEIAVSTGDPELIALVEKEAGIEVDVPPPAPEPNDADTADQDGDTEAEEAGDAAPSDEDILAGDDAPAGN